MGVFPVDIFIWAYLYIYFIVAFYEHFLDEDKYKGKMSKNIGYWLSFALFLVILFLVIYLVNKNLLVVSNFYFIIILFMFVMPIITICWMFPSLVKKIAIQGTYFFFLSIVYELVALNIGHWEFSRSHVVGWIELFGFGFAFEEFVWLMLAVPAVICLYEIIADDKK